MQDVRLARGDVSHVRLVSRTNHEEDAGEAEVLEESRDVDFLPHSRSILSIRSGPRVVEDTSGTN